MHRAARLELVAKLGRSMLRLDMDFAGAAIVAARTSLGGDHVRT